MEGLTKCWQTVGKQEPKKETAAPVCASSAQQVITVLMNQTCPGTSTSAEEGILNMHELGDADKLVHRNMMNEPHATPLADPTMTFHLNVSSGGRTAVVGLDIDIGLSVGDTPNNHFGGALVCQRITIDLAISTPTITDIQFAQAPGPLHYRRLSWGTAFARSV